MERPLEEFELWGAPFKKFHGVAGQKIVILPIEAEGDPLADNGKQLAIYSEITDGIYTFRGLLTNEYVEWAFKDIAKKNVAAQKHLP